MSFAAGIASIYFIFMRLVDRVNQKMLFGAGALLQVIGMLLLSLFRLTEPVALGYVLLAGIGGGFGQQSFFQLWSGELFPTLLRSTAQGLMFAVVRIALGFWSLYVPTLTKNGFSTLAWILRDRLRRLQRPDRLRVRAAERGQDAGADPAGTARQAPGPADRAGSGDLVRCLPAVSRKGGRSHDYATDASQAALRAPGESARRVA